MKQSPDNFNFESTPVVDLKRSSGVAGLNWDNEKTEVYLEDEGAGSAYLVNTEGERFPISAFPFVIGRGNECDLVLNGKGISRKHVEVVFQSGRFVVNDLDSLNGIKVNGYKVARVILEEGDSIKLGEISLVFTASSSTEKKNDVNDKSENSSSKSALHEDGANWKTKKTALPIVKKVSIGLLAGMLLSGIGLLGYQYYNSNKFISGVNGTSPTPAPSPSASSEANSATVSSGSVSAIQIQPESATQTTVSQSARTEAPSAIQVDHSVQGMEPPPSIAASIPASPVLDPKKIEHPVKRRPVNVQEKTATVKSIKTVLVAAKKPTMAPPQSENKQLLSASDVDRRYLKGDAETLIRELSAVASDVKLSSATRQSAKSKYGQILKIYNLYSAGNQQYIEGRKPEALKSWSEFLKEEKSFTNGQKSIYTSSVVGKVIDEYMSIGNSASQQGKNHLAYKSWSSALQFGDSVAARIAIDNANQKSKQLYRQALRLEYVNTERAKSLWKQVVDLVPPGTEYYTKASSKLAWYDKWGA